MLKLQNFKRILQQNDKLQRCLCSAAPKDPKTSMSIELTKSSAIQTKQQAKAELATKEDMKWRTPWHEKEGEYYTMLRGFYDDKPASPFLRFVQQPFDMSPSAFKGWWAKKKEREAIALQQYLPERHAMLGSELAAAHFLVHRGAAVKFFGDDKWIKANALNDYELPKKYQDDLYLQAIDCTDVELYYEGMVNLKNLKSLEWLSLNGCEKLDDWALDRIGNIFSHSLLYLDLRNIPDITHRGIEALCKLEHLKILYIDDIFASKEFEMTCLLLQEHNPSLDIRIEY